MKGLLFAAVILLFSLLFSAAKIAAEDRWTIDGTGDDVRMKPQYDYDFSKRYRGSIDDDGYTRLRNPSTGDTIRGYIDEDGYGRLRDSEGNSWRVRPR